MNLAEIIKKNKRLSILLFIFVFLCLILVVFTESIQRPGESGEIQAADSQIYWGASISGSDYGSYGNPPWDMTPVTLFENNTGKKVSIIKFGLPWYCSVDCGYTGYRPFSSSIDAIRQHGSIPLVDWASTDYNAGANVNQPKFSSAALIRGDHDAYIRQWATDAKNYGKPFFLRFDWEMNGDWYNWSDGVNGNTAGQYVLAWKHVHDIFKSVGVTNVTWVWSPNTVEGTKTTLAQSYPGDAYVDWVGIDGYNWGNANSSGWRSFDTVFKATYDQMKTLAPTKPIMIAEVGCNENGAPAGSSKSTWVTDMLNTQLQNYYSGIKALVYFNAAADGVNWKVETTTAATSAFKSAVASTYYGTNSFANLTTSPITPYASSTGTTATPATPLSVKISSPVNGTAVGGNRVSITAAVTGSQKIATVDYYVDGKKMYSQATSTSYTYNWQTKKYAAGSHTIKVVANDTSGQSSYHQITVNLVK